MRISARLIVRNISISERESFPCTTDSVYPRVTYFSFTIDIGINSGRTFSFVLSKFGGYANGDLDYDRRSQ